MLRFAEEKKKTKQNDPPRAAEQMDGHAGPPCGWAITCHMPAWETEAEGIDLWEVAPHFHHCRLGHVTCFT